MMVGRDHEVKALLEIDPELYEIGDTEIFVASDGDDSRRTTD